MRKSKVKIVYTSCVLILLLSLITFLSLRKIPETIYVSNSIETSNMDISSNFLIKNYSINKDEIEVKFLGFIPLKSVRVSKINDLELYPGGNTVGIKLSTKGVLVVGYSDVNCEKGQVESPAKRSGIQLGDVIVKINGEEIENSRDLSRKISECKDSRVTLQYLRNDVSQNKEINLEKEGDNYRLGLWVRDSTAGIGTLTFYHKESKTFGALGHPITDGDTNEPFIIKDGNLLDSSVISIKRGEKGMPGELKGLFLNEKVGIATIKKNTESGIFGTANNNIASKISNKPLKIAFRNEIKEGKAQIITTVDESGPKLYDIEIIKLLPQDEPGPKSMLIKVTDEELLEKTGGIVQGMSGSPIIQDNKIIGAVTHVLINKPDVGYGIYIEWMLKDAGIIN